MTTSNESVALQGLKQLLQTSSPAELGPRIRLGALPVGLLNDQVDALISKSTLPERGQNLIRGTLLLWHDHLDEAHSIAQIVEDSDGNLLHAITHRREPDYGNSKYWFRRAGKHPCYSRIASQVQALVNARDANLTAQLLPGGVWDPSTFVDACEAAERRQVAGGEKTILQEIQRIESASFLEHLCGHRALHS
ncbi:MAG: hypothetical protein EXS30_02415 [Pedosphaera sp.]|nr:hypothetical protein [Pedosphaera sp.]